MLSFEQAPPVAASFRFFLTAPWFGVAAGLLLAWNGAPAFASRWTPAALALTHLLTVGFMLQAMCGALLQFIPVATGANVWQPRLLAALVHPALLAGALLLAFAMASSSAGLLPWAGWLLGAGLAGFCTVAGLALLRTGASGVSLRSLRAAVAGLSVTAALGLLLAQMPSSRTVAPLPAVVDLHAAWGLGGWALSLLAGVSFAVVPMFQMTPPYPPWLPRVMPATLGLALIGATLAALAPGPARLVPLAIAPAVLAAVGFSLVTLRLQRRRRARTDASIAFSRGAMASLAMSGLGCLACIVVPDRAEAPWLPIGIGILCVVGVFVSAISGMLYKIVPFIAWLSISERVASPTAPSIKTFIGERAMAAQMRLHFAALAMLMACLAFPPLVRGAGLVFAVSCAWLGMNLLRGVRVYLSLRDRNRAASAGHGS
jgi:hypothetical protein